MVNSHSQTAGRWLILTAILIGFGLRIYTLDVDSLWNDEAGQALAAIQPSVAEMLTYVRSHAGAMPMDYFVTRLFAQLSTEEFVLRLPPLFWSTAAMALLVALAKWVIGQRVAIIAVWLMAFAPQLIHYAQEARPYAALLFFSLLATYLLLRALADGGVLQWVSWGIVTVVGAYFHLYVLLTAAYAGVFILLSILGARYATEGRIIRLLILFLGYFAVALLLVMPGYFFFVSQDTYRYELFQYGGNLWSVTATGLGWPIQRYLPQSALLICLTVVGIIAVARQWSEHIPISLLLSVPCIVMAIFLMDITKGYWYLPRQLLHLQPILLIFTATGCWFIAEYLMQRVPSTVARYKFIPSGVAVILVAIVLLSGVPRLLDEYAFSKGNGRALTNLLLTLSSDTTTTIHVQPAYEVKLYVFYATTMSSDSSALISALRPATWEEVLGPVTDSGHQYLVAPLYYIAENMTQLRSAGYHPILEPPVGEGYLRSLWGRP